MTAAAPRKPRGALPWRKNAVAPRRGPLPRAVSRRTLRHESPVAHSRGAKPRPATRIVAASRAPRGGVSPPPSWRLRRTDGRLPPVAHGCRNKNPRGRMRHPPRLPNRRWAADPQPQRTRSRRPARRRIRPPLRALPRPPEALAPEFFLAVPRAILAAAAQGRCGGRRRAEAGAPLGVARTVSRIGGLPARFWAASAGIFRSRQCAGPRSRGCRGRWRAKSGRPCPAYPLTLPCIGGRLSRPQRRSLELPE